MEDLENEKVKKEKPKKRKKVKPYKKAPNWMFWILRRTLGPMLKSKYKYSFDKSTSKGITRPCLILSNHQTGFDQFAVGLGFKFAMNFVASDTLFKHGIGSFLMKHLGRPIPFTKGASDPIAVKSMMQVISAGGAVGIFAEGARSFFGETMRIQPGTARLAKKFAVPLVLVQLRGGYLTKPRFKTVKNKGKCTGQVVRVVSVEELKALTNDELEAIIKESLYVNEFDYNKEAKIEFKGKAKAEHLESILFYCPSCGGYDCLNTQVHDLWCNKCKVRVTVDDYGFFVNAPSNTTQLPATILDWSKLQIDFIKAFDYNAFGDKPIFKEDSVEMFKAIRAKKQDESISGSLELYTDKFVACGKEFYFKDITSISMNDVKKISFYTATDTYSITAPLKTNLAKYMFCGYHLKNTAEGKEEFYGY